MNDNVEKLKKQAMEIYVYTDYYGDKQCVLRLNEEKFAKLIIKECCTVINDYGDHVRKVEDNWDGKSAYLGMKIRGSVYEIEGHFGVEE